MTQAAGVGPGVITTDGCAVEIYRRLPTTGEPALIHDNIPPGSRILDLGAGVGRIADPLVKLGHHVTAVDNSQAMLASVRRAETVLADIEELHLDQQFDVVLLASHLLNTPDPIHRHKLLASAARHLRPDGRCLLQWHTPEWFDRLHAGETYEGRVGDIVTILQVHSLEADLLNATVSYHLDDQAWHQHFISRRLQNADAFADLQTAGLHWNRLLPDPSWIEARPASPRSSS